MEQTRKDTLREEFLRTYTYTEEECGHPCDDYKDVCQYHGCEKSHLRKFRLTPNIPHLVLDFFFKIIESQEDEVEKLIMQLAACGVAAMSNTRETAKENILPDHSPYFTASYDEVCCAVNREMNLREELSSLKEQLTIMEQIIKNQDMIDKIRKTMV